MSWTDRKQAVFRRLLKTRAFTRFYGRVIGPASAQMFGEVLADVLLPQLPPDAKVLEVGCGPGLQAIDLVRRRSDLKMTASDFSSAFVDLARANAELARAEGAPPLPIEFVVADAMDLSAFPNESFDAVYSITAIKHFPDPVLGLRECLRVVKRGGPIVVAEIRRESGLEEVQNLVNLFQLSPRLRSFAASFVNASLREECPPLGTVEGWLKELRREEANAVLQVLAGRPAWVATLRQPVAPT